MGGHERHPLTQSGYWKNSCSDRISRGIARFRDPFVRELLEGLHESFRSDATLSRGEIMAALRDVIETIPVSVCGVDAVAAALRKELKKASRRRGRTKLRAWQNTSGAIAGSFEYMAGLEVESNDPGILWIRENRGMLEQAFQRRSVIAAVISSNKETSFFRMVEIGRKTPQLMEFDTDAQFIQDLAIEVAAKHILVLCARNRSHGIQGLKTVSISFSESLGGDVPKSLAEFGDKHLAAQMEFHKDDLFARWALTRLYLAIVAKQGARSLLASEGVTADFLAHAQFADAYAAGYRAVALSPLDQPPSFDRWFIFPNGAESGYASGKPNKGHRVDFLQIDEPLRHFAKRWFWEGDISLLGRVKSVQALASFLSWRKTSLSFASLKDKTRLIHSEEVELYLLSAQKNAGSTLGTKQAAISAFVEFLESESPELVDPLCRYVAGSVERKRDEQQEPKAMTEEHYRLMEAELEKRSSNSTRDLLTYVVFLLTGSTPIRVTSVLDLKLSHIVETARAGRRAIRQPSKTTGRDARGHELTPKAKRALDLAIRETQPLRDLAPEKMRDYVFLVRSSSSKGSIIALPYASYKNRLRYLCTDLGIPKYGPAEVRKRYMTDADDAADDLGMGREAKAAMTGHVDPATDRKHYIHRDPVKYYEALYGVEVGTAKVRGELSAKKPEGLSEADEVAGGSGWCGSERCGGVVSCLICPHFRTTPEHIPAFKANIEEIDVAIAALDTDHDRGHLAAYKALNVAYICELEELATQAEGGLP